MNILAIIVAGLLNMVFGMIFYSDMLFGKMWMKLAGVKDMKPNPAGMALGAFSSIVMSYALYVFLSATGTTSVLNGALVGAAVSLGFIGTTSMGTILLEKKPVMLYLLNNAYYVVLMAVMGAFLVAWA